MGLGVGSHPKPTQIADALAYVCGRGHGLLRTLPVCYTFCYIFCQQGADKSPELAEIWARLLMGSTPTSSAKTYSSN